MKVFEEKRDERDFIILLSALIFAINPKMEAAAAVHEACHLRDALIRANDNKELHL